MSEAEVMQEAMAMMPGGFKGKGVRSRGGGITAVGGRLPRGAAMAPPPAEAAGDGAGADDTAQSTKVGLGSDTVGEKRISLYASQGGGCANPSKKKKRARYGAPSGPQH